jgi:hypothetical protein
VVQGALKLILEPIFEADFQPGSYGYRPKRTAHEAIHRVAQGIVEAKTKIIDLDLRAYFDTVQHSLLLDKVAKRVRDDQVLRLLKMILKATGKKWVPQGGVITPRTQSITSIWSGGSSLSGEPGTANDTWSTLDSCLLQLYLYGICVPTPLNGRNASICREASWSVAGHWQMQFDSSPRYVPSHVARHIAM